MKDKKKTAVIVVLAIVSVVAITATTVLAVKYHQSKQSDREEANVEVEPTIIPDVTIKVHHKSHTTEISKELSEVSYLTTEEFKTEKIYYSENSLTENKIIQKLTTNSYKIDYVMYLKAGIDFSKITFKEEYDSEDNLIVLVTLPDVEVTAKYIDQDSIKILDEKNNVFNKINLEQAVAEVDDQFNKDVQEAIDAGVCEKAEVNAEAQVADIIKQICGSETTVYFN